MPAKVSGVKSTSILQPEESGEMDRYGVDMITRVEKVPVGMFPALLRGEGSVHPRYSSMAVSKRSFSLDHAGQFYKVTYLYEGFLLNLPAATYELSSGVMEEPIQTHVDFVSELAGTPLVPKNNAVFVDPETNKPTTDDEKGVFREFGTGEMAGVESFRTSTAIWTETYFSVSRPTDLGQLGKKDNPSGPNPSFGEGTNWMYVSATYRKRGHIYEVKKSWELSGRKGWNDLLYGS